MPPRTSGSKVWCLPPDGIVPQPSTGGVSSPPPDRDHGGSSIPIVAVEVSFLPPAVHPAIQPALLLSDQPPQNPLSDLLGTLLGEELEAERENVDGDRYDNDSSMVHSSAADHQHDFLRLQEEHGDQVLLVSKSAPNPPLGHVAEDDDEVLDDLADLLGQGKETVSDLWDGSDPVAAAPVSADIMSAYTAPSPDLSLLAAAPLPLLDLPSNEALAAPDTSIRPSEHLVPPQMTDTVGDMPTPAAEREDSAAPAYEAMLEIAEAAEAAISGRI